MPAIASRSSEPDRAGGGEVLARALDHYRKMIEALIARGHRAVVTIHHFTLPLWLADQGGWSRRASRSTSSGTHPGLRRVQGTCALVA